MLCINTPGQFTCIKKQNIVQNNNLIEIPIEFKEFIGKDEEGRPTISLPSKPLKREQLSGEKNKKYKKYLEEEFKPSVEVWKETTEQIKAVYNEVYQTNFYRKNCQIFKKLLKFRKYSAFFVLQRLEIDIFDDF